ncbi:MAG: oligosaccharide flippase family protein [Anaerolineae bacterium]|nr:oligosaccharide flippase family protein [Anaerolineae bacterium]
MKAADLAVPESDTPLEPAEPRAKHKSTSFVGDALKLLSGSVFAQVLSLAASPLLARLYGPEAFGLSALFTSITGLVAVVVCLRYELAIMLPESDEEAANLFAGSLAIAFLMTLSTVPLVWLGRPFIVRLLNAPELAPYFWLVPIVTFFGGIAMGHPALNYWSSRSRRFGRLSRTRVISSTVTTATEIGAGFAGYVTGGSLIGARVAGSIISTSVLAIQTFRDDGRLLLRSVRWRSVLAGLKQHYKFPLYTTWSSLLNTVSSQLPAFLLSAFFSSAVVGYYALGYRLLGLPMSLFGGSVSQVFFQRAAEARVQGRLAVLVEGAFRRLVMFGTFPILLLTIIGRDLFVVVFGERWAEAGVYTQILSTWVFFQLMSGPLSTLFSVLQRQEMGLRVNLLLIITRFLALGIGGLLGNARLALALFSASGILGYGWMCIWILKASQVPRAQVLQVLSRYLGVSIVILLPLGLAKCLLPVPPLLSLVAAAIASGVYAYFVIRSEPQLGANLARFVSSGGWRRKK